VGVLLLGVVFGGVCLVGCAGKTASEHAYDDSYRVNEPNKGEKCYDASILLAEDLGTANDLSKKALLSLDSTIEEDTPTFLKAQRKRHVGVFVGSGGEEIFVQLEEVAGGRTFVKVATKTGFVGGAGQKAWSCEVVDTIAQLATK
jgi:hypothetical protein